MRATPTTTPRYALMKEQLQKETWTPYTWSFANSKCGGGMWVPRSKFFSEFISYFWICVCPRIFLYKKMKKMMRGVAMVTTLSLHQQIIMVSTLNVLLLTLNKAMSEGCPRITRFVLIPISLWIMLNHASCSLYMFLYAPVWMCGAQRIHRRFYLSMVLGLKCLLRSNWHGVKFD